MDPDLLLFLTPLFFTAVLGLPPLFLLVSTRTRLRGALDVLPPPDPSATATTLTPAGLAYLCGGERRAVETALMGMHLDGRVRLRRGGLLVDETGDEAPDPADPLRGDLEKTLRRTGPIPVVDLLRLGRSGRGVTQIRQGLVERGLMVDSRGLHEALLNRNGLSGLVGFCVFVGFLAVVIGILAGGIGEAYDGLPHGIITAGLVLSLLGFLSMLTATLTGGWRLSLLSSAGRNLARAARAEYGSPATDTLTRDEALRRTAVHGMGQLRSTGRRTGGGAVAAVGGDSSDGEPTGFETGEEPWIALETLHGFAEQCVRVSGFDGGGGDGGGGGGDGGGGGG